MSRLLRFAASLCIAALATGAVAVCRPAAAADPISDGQWYVAAMQLDAAHKITQGEGVMVAIIDTGVDATHPDLAGSVVAGTDTSLAGPGDGLTDPVGHGTGMAGLVVGHGKTRGVAPKATLVSIRAETGGGGSPTAVGAAINWAVAKGVAVISISLASPDSDVVLQQAVDNALRHNVVVVAGAGNTDKNLRVGYPAAIPGVIAVGGVGPDGNHSSSAVTGPEVVLAAPSDKISTPYTKHQWAVGTGTSNAAALVAGAAALLRAKFPNLPARDVAHRLTATAVDRGASGRDSQYGYGVVNLVPALTAEVAPLPAQTGAGSILATAPSSTPLAAPGAEFPLTLFLIIGAGLLVVTVAVVVLVRQRRRT
jgi:type VII secretion-associated serine protease mycosin